MNGACAATAAGVVLAGLVLVLPPPAGIACAVLAVLVMASEATRRARVIRGRKARERAGGRRRLRYVPGAGQQLRGRTAEDGEVLNGEEGLK